MSAFLGRLKTIARELFAALRFWSGASVNRRIFVAGINTGFGGAIARLTFALRELVIAYQFGAAPLLGAFLITAVLPTYCAQIVAGSVPLVVVPALIREWEGGEPNSGGRLFAMINAALAGLMAATAAAMVAAFPAYLDIAGAKFTPDERALAASLLIVMIPFMILRGVNAVWAAALSAKRHFLLPALTPAITPAVTSAAVLWRHEVSVIAWSMTAGMALETAVVGFAAVRVAQVSLLPRLPRLTPAFRGAIGQFLPVLFGSVLIGATVVVDQSMAARVSAESVPVVYYANLLILFPVVLAAAALGAAVLPYAAQLVGAANWRGLRHTVMVYLRGVAFVTVPLTILVVIFAEPLVSLVFERGAFAAADAGAVAKVTRFMALQIPFYIGAIVLIQVLSALRRNDAMLWASGLGLVLKVALNLALMPAMGLAGIGLATSIMYAATFALLLMFCRRALRVNAATAADS